MRQSLLNGFQRDNSVQYIVLGKVNKRINSHESLVRKGDRPATSDLNGT